MKFEVQLVPVTQVALYFLLLNAHFFGSSRPEVFLGEGVLEVCSKFTGERPCRGAISMKLQSNFVEIALRRGYSQVGFLRIFGAPFPENTSGWLFLLFLLCYKS